MSELKEIRLRQISPTLNKQIGEVMIELSEKTVSGALEKLIPRYFDMKKRIIECNQEIAKLAQELRSAQNKFSNSQTNLADLIIYTRNFNKDVQKTLAEFTKTFNKYGTKKSQAPRPGGPGRRKNVPTKKKGGKK